MEYVFGGFLNSIGEKLNNAATGNLKQKNYEKAITWYSRALLFTSLNRFPTFLSNRSLCHFKLKDYKSALVDSRKALEYDKKCEMAYEGIIKPCIHLGDFDGAENAIESLKTINPNNEYLKKAIWDCNYVTTLEKEAATCSKFKNFERAIEKISIALTYASNSDHLLSLKNQYTLEKENQNESSRVLYKDACKNYNLGHFEESLSIISQIIMNDPNYEKAIELMAKTKQFKEQKDLGNSFFGKQNYLKAYQLYREALKIDPSNIKMQSILHHNLAATNFNLLDYKQGIRDATAAIQHNPKYTKAYVIRAKCYFHLENYKESTQDCKFILLIETNNEIENLLKKCHLEESNIILIKEVTLRANLNFIRNNFKDCIIDCKKILEIKEIEDIRKLLERAECEESNRILIIKLLNQAEHYYQIPNYDLCVEECDKILKIQYCCKAKVLKDKAMSQIEQRRSLKCFLLTANSLFQQNDYKNCKHYCNLILSNTFEAGPRDPNKIEVNYLLEKIRKHVDEIIDQAKRNFILKNFNQCILDCVNILNIEESNEVNNLLKAARSEEDIINRIESIRTLFKTDCFKNCLNECYQILNMREMPEARQYLKNIRELIDKSMAQARIHLYLGYFDKCIKDCENVLNIEESNEAKQLIIRARSEKDINDRLSRIRTYYNKECFKDCITECNQILKIEEIPEARQILRKIRELINKSMAQAKRNFNLDNFDQCIMDCQFILNIEDSYEAFDLLDSARTEQVSKTIINEGLNRARRLYDTKYFRECIDECKNLLKIKEISEASNLIKMCESDIETAQSQTIEKLRKIAITFYDNKDYKKCKSHCYKILRIKELKAVRELLRKANLGIKNQKYINDIMIRARQHFQNKKYKECIAECENILRIEDIEEAKTLMNDAKFEMDRKYINDIMSRARLQFKNENYKECINECLKALEIGDLMEAKTLMKNAKAKMHEKVINEIMERARTNFKQTHYKECIEDCQKALEVDHGLMEAKSLMEKAKLELVNASKNFVKNKIVQAKIQFDKAEYEKCFVSCSSILEKEDVADVKDMLKTSKIALAYEKLTDPYEILEVSRSSDQLTIKSSYYLLSVRYHPDKHSKSTKEMRVYSENLYKKITNAYRSLSR